MTGDIASSDITEEAAWNKQRQQRGALERSVENFKLLTYLLPWKDNQENLKMYFLKLKL